MKKQEGRYGRNWIYTIGILALTGVTLFLSSKIFRPEPMVKSTKTITALLSGKLTFPMAPENISSIPLYHIHYNLWDTILLANGEPAIARLIDTSEGKLFRFEIVPNTRFSNGRKIESSDIIFSINRLLSRQSEGHFSVKQLIEKVSAISSSVFEIKLKHSAASFLFLLSIPEMGVVPREACAENGDIKELDITSGAYTVSEKPQADQISLTKNQYFQRSDGASPQKVRLQFTTSSDQMVQTAEKERADFVEIYESNGSATFQKLIQNTDFSYKATRPSYSVFLVLNPAHLKAPVRLRISQLVHAGLEMHYKLTPEIEKISYEILPPKTFGSLGLDSYSSLPKADGPLPKKLRLACYDKNSNLVKAILEILTASGIEVQLVDVNPAVDYDLKLLGQGMNADFPEIEFHLNLVSTWATIEATNAEKSKIRRAIESDNKTERSELIQSVGQSLIEDGRVIPLIVRSYVHVYRKNRINIDQVSDYDGDVPFGLIRVENL